MQILQLLRKGNRDENRYQLLCLLLLFYFFSFISTFFIVVFSFRTSFFYSFFIPFIDIIKRDIFFSIKKRFTHKFLPKQMVQLSFVLMIFVRRVIETSLRRTFPNGFALRDRCKVPTICFIHTPTRFTHSPEVHAKGLTVCNYFQAAN